MTATAMSLMARLGIGVVAGLLASCASYPADAPTASFAAETDADTITLENVRAVAKKFIANGTHANVVVGVALPDGSEVWMEEGTLAFDSDVPADEQSLYRIYSMTKPITGVAAAILIDEGRLGLDQPVCDFIEAFCETEVLVDKETFGETRPAAGPVLVRHLMTHTSGLGYSIIPSALVDSYIEAGIVPGVRRENPFRPSGPQPTNLQEFATRAGNLPLRVDPGTEWHYSIGVDVLGAVVEKASGMPFEAFVNARILEPLGMDDTGFTVESADLDRLTTNYALVNGRAMVFDTPADSEYSITPPYPAGGAGLASTAEDYLRFVEAMANEGRLDNVQVLGPSMVELATSNLMPEGLPFTGFAWANQGFGAGGRVITNATPVEPANTYGWGGAASTLAASYLDQDIAYVMMTQLMLDSSTGMQQEFLQALAADLAPVMGH